MKIIIGIELAIGLGLILFYVFCPRVKRESILSKIGFLASFLSLIIVSQIFHGISFTKLGLRFDNFWQAIKLWGPLVLAGALIFITIGLLRKTVMVNRYFIITFLFYPVWAFAQQYLIIGFFFQKFQIFFGINIISILLCAIIFSFLHYPDKKLMLTCFIAAIIWILLFIRVPNLFISALFHGWLAAIYYYFTLGEDCLKNDLKSKKGAKS